jgi:hypothetical protein
MHTWTTHFLTLTSLAVALGVNHAPTNPLRRSEECVTKALALRNLTALAPQIVLDSAIPENNAVVFQLFNPVTQVSGECAAHGDTLSPDALTGRPDIWYNCFVESRDPTITVEFQFDSSLNRLTVNETWTCADDEDDLYVYQNINKNFAIVMPVCPS